MHFTLPIPPELCIILMALLSEMFIPQILIFKLKKAGEVDILLQVDTLLEFGMEQFIIPLYLPDLHVALLVYL